MDPLKKIKCESLNKGFFPKKTFIIAVLTTITVLGVMIFGAISGYRYIVNSKRDYDKHQKAYHDFMSSNELRLTTVFFAVLKNEAKLKQRYDQANAQLMSQLALLQEIHFTQEEKSSFNRVKNSINHLSGLDSQIFSSLVNGRQESARSLITGGAYSKELTTYISSIQILSDLIIGRIFSEITIAENRALIIAIFIIVSYPIMAIMWIGIVILYLKKKKQYNEAHALIKNSEMRYRSLFENTQDVIIIINADTGIIEDVNPIFEKNYGYSQAEYIGKEIWNCPSLRTIIPSKERLDDIAHKKNIIFQNVLLETKDNRDTCAHIVGGAYNYDHIHVIQLTIRDITKLRHAEQSWRRIQEEYMNLIENNEDVIIVLQDNKIKFVNKKISTTFGFQQEDILEKSFIDFVAPEHRKLVAERYVNRLAGEKTEFRYEIDLLSKKGEYIPIEINASLTLYQDKSAVMAVVRDMRQKKRLERLRHDFVSIVSHQLRTPLTGIKWFAELLLNNKENRLTSFQKNYIQNIYESNQRMICLIDELMEVSRIQEDTKFSIVPKQEDVMCLAHDAVERQSIIAKKKNISVCCLIKKTEKIVIKIDSEKIMQVFQNLIANAIKYSPEGSMVELGCSRENDKIIFFVKDHGVGMPTDEQVHVFEKFFRGSNIKTKESGTGLGLFIAKIIIERHGGSIWFESKENNGSTFYFSLPIIH